MKNSLRSSSSFARRPSPGVSGSLFAFDRRVELASALLGLAAQLLGLREHAASAARPAASRASACFGSAPAPAAGAGGVGPASRARRPCASSRSSAIRSLIRAMRATFAASASRRLLRALGGVGCFAASGESSWTSCCCVRVRELDRLLEIRELLDRLRERDQRIALVRPSRRRASCATSASCALIHRGARLGDERQRDLARCSSSFACSGVSFGVARPAPAAVALDRRGEPRAHFLDAIAQPALAIAERRRLEPRRDQRRRLGPRCRPELERVLRRLRDGAWSPASSST